MKYKNKPFQSRPWVGHDNGLIKHYEDLEVTELEPLNGAKAFFICLHTSIAMLKENAVKGAEGPIGWFWPKFKINNFRVTSCQNVIGFFMTDGIIPGHKFDVCLKDGTFTDLAGPGPLLSFQHINFGDLQLERLCLKNVETPKIEIRNCTITSLKIYGCKDLRFDIVDSQIRRVELFDSSGITFGNNPPQDIVELPWDAVGVTGSMSAIVSIGGKLFRGDAANAVFKEYR